MSANLQYHVKYPAIGANFTKAVPADRREMDFILETGESRYTMKVDLSDLLDHVLSEYEFDDIASVRNDIENITDDSTETAEELRQQLINEYGAEGLANYDEFNGDYSAYAQYLGNKILTDMNDYADDLEDVSVFVETWL